MGRRAGPPRERHHVHLFPGDWDWLIETYSPSGVTPASVIAQVIHKWRRKVEEKQAVKLTSARNQEIEVDIDVELPDNAIGTSSDDDESAG